MGGDHKCNDNQLTEIIDVANNENELIVNRMETLGGTKQAAALANIAQAIGKNSKEITERDEYF